MLPHRVLFVSLARAGSKRLRNKNLLAVGGVSLIGRAILVAKRTLQLLGEDGEVVVSTDDEQIGAESRYWGGKTPFLRPASLSSDTASSVDALRHVVEWYQQRGEQFTEVVLLQPTSPLRAAEDVVAAVRKFREKNVESVVTVGPPTGGGPDVTYGLDEDLLVGDSESAVKAELNGAVYVCSPSWLFKNDRLTVSGVSRAVFMPAKRSIDVDTSEDLRVAKAYWENGLLWPSDKCLIIAEAGVNHNGSVDTAKRLVDAAAEAGADAVKFQTFSADSLASRNSAKAFYQQETTGKDASQHDMLSRLELSDKDHEKLLGHCTEREVVFLSSAFDEHAVDLLVRLNVPAIKVGSGEITNHPLLKRIGETMRPVILSTGCSWLHEVGEAVEVLRRSGCGDLALLHCVSNYPAVPADVNLLAMKTLGQAFGLPVGYSDHTLGCEISCAAVALGARIIEKHFTLDKTDVGPDHRASIEPDELVAFVQAIRRVECAMGDGIKQPVASEANTREVARRSIVAAEDISAGTVLRAEQLLVKRPGTGISPAAMENIVGLTMARDLAADDPLTWSHLQVKGIES